MSNLPDSAGSLRGIRLLAVAVLLTAAPAGAEPDGPVLDGSVSATWYHQGSGSDNGLEAANADSRMLERIRLNARRIAPGVDFRTSFAVRHWFGADKVGSETRIHQAYVKARAPGRWSSVSGPKRCATSR